MLFSIPLWIISYAVILLIETPLAAIGSLAVGSWSTAMAQGIQFMFRPFFYLQGFIDVSLGLQSLGWDMGIFTGYIIWVLVKSLAGWIRGNDIHIEKIHEGR